jgi:steroid delta-isomerase-like uncharacterized protein
MSEQNKNLIRRAVEEVWNRRNFASLSDLVSSDFVVHSAGEEIHGREGVKQFYSMLHRAFPDIRFTIKDQIAEGDKVVTHWTARGTHRGEFNGIPATGKQFNVSAIDIDRIADGKVVECWTNMDQLGLLQQLGIVPNLESQDVSERTGLDSRSLK